MPHPLRLESEILELRTRHPFIIARGGQSDYRTVLVRLIDGDGVEGWGEAAPTICCSASVVQVGQIDEHTSLVTFDSQEVLNAQPPGGT